MDYSLIFLMETSRYMLFAVRRILKTGVEFSEQNIKNIKNVLKS